MAKFQVIDRISDAGDARKANDDWMADNAAVAIVADGATGLSPDRFIKEADSDAQWIAKLACERLIEKPADEPIREIVTGICGDTRKALFDQPEEVEIPRYAWPLAAFIAVRQQGAMLEITGLADCMAYLQFKDGFVQPVSALLSSQGQEAEDAAKDIQQKQEGIAPIEDEAVLISLRERRAMLNTLESNVWCIGPVIEAADHVLSMAIPIEEVEHVLIASDGFSAIVEDYSKYDGAGLIAKIKADGMVSVVEEIRAIERKEDPEMSLYPRYKQSDDSTAILLKMEN